MMSTPVIACDLALLLFQTDECVSFVFTYINPLLVIPSLIFAAVAAFIPAYVSESVTSFAA